MRKLRIGRASWVVQDHTANIAETGCKPCVSAWPRVYTPHGQEGSTDFYLSRLFVIVVCLANSLTQPLTWSIFCSRRLSQTDKKNKGTGLSQSFPSTSQQEERKYLQGCWGLQFGNNDLFLEIWAHIHPHQKVGSHHFVWISEAWLTNSMCRWSKSIITTNVTSQINE